MKPEFDSIFIYFNEGKPDNILVRTYRNGEPQHLAIHPLTITHSKEFWNIIQDNPGGQTKESEEMSLLQCPVCQSRRDTFLRDYDGRKFCGFCGSHLKLVDGKLIVIAKLG